MALGVEVLTDTGPVPGLLFIIIFLLLHLFTLCIYMLPIFYVVHL